MFIKLNNRAEEGQAIVLVAIALVALIAMMGLLIDGGIVFNDYSQLKKAADAAAISAALQYREGYTTTTLTDSATEFMNLNEINAVDIVIDTCDTDSTLCTNPRRKLVRVSASKVVNFGFLPIIGIDSTKIKVVTVGEAASVDVVLVIDASASMAYEGGGDPNRPDDPADDPATCNPAHSCQPFEQIKTSAKAFVNSLYFPYDRVAVVTFDRNPNPGAFAPWVVDTNGNGIAKDEALALIDNLTVFQPPACDTAFGPCLNYDSGGNFIGLECPLFRSTGDPSSCGSSNIGGGLVVAGNSFAPAPVREDSLWVVILLAGGPANTTLPDLPSYPYGYCPTSTWTSPFCRDASASTRHCADPATRTACEATGGVWNPTEYDADDYARDMADFVTSPDSGQNAVIYAIGLGNLMQNAPSGDPDAGEQLLRYAAEASGGPDANNGIYYAAPTVAELRDIFRDIAENIATRLAH
ncbi:MAG: VWA domain-containing protein [Anaerolineales bacterium]|nr:VWA domain-containing protein [Anaerolineales bacterium]